MAGLIASEEACEVVRDMEIEVLYTENVQSRSKIIGKLYSNVLTVPLMLGKPFHTFIHT